MDSKKTQTTMSDLVGDIYRIRTRDTGSIIVPYDDEARMSEVLRKIRNAPDPDSRRFLKCVLPTTAKKTRENDNDLRSPSQRFKN